MFKIQQTKPIINDLVSVNIGTTDYVNDPYIQDNRYAHDHLTIPSIPIDETLIGHLSIEKQELINLLLNDPDLERLGVRYAKCQSGLVWVILGSPKLMRSLGFNNDNDGRHDFRNWFFSQPLKEKEKLIQNGDIVLTKQTCDSKFCDDPSCVARRNKRVIDRFNPVLQLFHNPNPHARMNIRGVELTSDLLPTSDNLKLFKGKVISFLRKKKIGNQRNHFNSRVFWAICAYHVHQGRLHAHLLVWGLFINAEMMTSQWNEHTKWTNTNVKQIKGGLKAHLGHLSKYIARPNLTKSKPFEAYNTIKEFHKTRLVTTFKLLNTLRRHRIDDPAEWIQIGGEFFWKKDSTLISISRNNSTSEEVKISEECVFSDPREEHLAFLEGEYG